VFVELGDECDEAFALFLLDKNLLSEFVYWCFVSVVTDDLLFVKSM